MNIAHIVPPGSFLCYKEFNFLLNGYHTVLCCYWGPFLVSLQKKLRKSVCGVNPLHQVICKVYGISNTIKNDYLLSCTPCPPSPPLIQFTNILAHMSV